MDDALLNHVCHFFVIVILGLICYTIYIFYFINRSRFPNLTPVQAKQPFHLLFIEELSKLSNPLLYIAIEDDTRLSYNVNRWYRSRKNNNEVEIEHYCKNITNILRNPIKENMLDLYDPSKTVYEILNTIICEQLTIFERIAPKNYTASDIPLNEHLVLRRELFKTLAFQLYITNIEKVAVTAIKWHVRKQMIGELKETMQKTYNSAIKTYYQELETTKDDDFYINVKPNHIIIYFKTGTILPNNVEVDQYSTVNGIGENNSFIEIGENNRWPDQDKTLYSIIYMTFYNPETDNWAFISVRNNKYILKEVKNDFTVEKVFKEWNLCFIIFEKSPIKL